MNNHEKINQLLPFYNTQQLDQKQMQEVQTHLKTCSTCQQDLEFWQTINQSIQVENTTSTPSLSPEIFTQISAKIYQRPTIQEKFNRFSQILKTQFQLIRKEIWPASFLVLLIGFVITVMFEFEPFFYAIAPLVSAASISVLYNRQNDPAFELVLSTPVSQLQILLIRLFIVFSYNSILVFLFSASLSLIYSTKVFSPLLFEWLAPMTFLSILGMTLSVILNSENAIFISYSVWLSKYIFHIDEIKDLSTGLYKASQFFWNSPQLIFVVSAVLFIILLIYIKQDPGKNISTTKPLTF
jgi:hypothetical protein